METRATTTLRFRDGRAAYIEPMAFASALGTYALLGNPVYVWKARGPESAGPPELDSSEALLGAMLDQSGHATGLPRPPLAGNITDVRLIRDADRYAAVFAVTEPPKRGQDPVLLGYWFGRTDGKRWTSLEQLPLVSLKDLNTPAASQLVRVGDVLMIAVPYGALDKNVAVYTQTALGWTRDTIHTVRAAYVALGTDSSTVFLYVVRPDTTRSDANSVSLFVRQVDSWHDKGFVVRGGRRPVHDPVVLTDNDVLTLSWTENDEVARTRRALAARIAPDGTLGEPVTLSSGIEDVFPVRGASGSLRWVVSARDSGSASLSLIEWRSGTPTVRDVVVNPFTGPALAYSTGEGDVIVGPIFSPQAGNEPLVSGILRFSPRCH